MHWCIEWVINVGWGFGSKKEISSCSASRVVGRKVACITMHYQVHITLAVSQGGIWAGC